MRKTLFRPEAVAAKENPWFGKVLLLQPLSLRLISAAVLMLTAAVVIFLFQAQYTRRITGSGVLAPDLGLVKVQSARAGVVLQRLVREGQSVHAGDVLYVVSSEVMYAPGDSGWQGEGMTAAMLSKLRERHALIAAERAGGDRLAGQERAQARIKLDSARQEIAQIDQEIAIQAERLVGRQNLYERNVQAQTQGFISSLALQQKYDELLDQKARLQAMRRSRLALQRQQTDAEATLAAVDDKAAQARGQLDRQMLEVEQDQVTREVGGRILVTAPEAGVVAAVFAEPGQRVDTQTMLTIVPQGSVLEAQMFVSSQAIAAMHEGDPVSLRLAAFPYQTFGDLRGQIGQISHTTLTAAEQSSEAVADAGGRYRVRIRLPAQSLTAGGRAQPLRSGMAFDAQLVVERRRLIDWLLEPVKLLREKA
jgi:membrane fusion protein